MDRYDILVSAILVCAVALPVGLVTCSEVRCAESKQVVKVGGCNRYGECGVMFADGSTGVATQPVEGGYVCAKTEHAWRWPWSKE